MIRIFLRLALNKIEKILLDRLESGCLGSLNEFRIVWQRDLHRSTFGAVTELYEHQVSGQNPKAIRHRGSAFACIAAMPQGNVACCPAATCTAAADWKLKHVCISLHRR
jgi:hypothetical protein